MLVTQTNTRAKFLQGNAACAEAALAVGVRFFAGYPITPSSEIAEILSRRLPKIGGKFMQMEDEIASIGAILGASLAGLKVMTATSGPGFSLKQELIGFACYCEIPCVIVNVQRGGPSTGLPTSPAQGDVMQARWGTHGDHSIIVLCPSSVREMYDLTIQAFNFAESLRIPVIILADEIVGHLYEKIEFPDVSSLKLLERPRPNKKPTDKYLPFATSTPAEVPRIADFGQGYRFNVTGLMHDFDGFPVNIPEKNENLIYRLNEKINSRLKEICLWESEDIERAHIIILSYGSTARASKEAKLEAQRIGIKVGIITLKTLWPFPDFIFERLNFRLKTILVCEMNQGQIVREVQRASMGKFKVKGVHTCRGTLITPKEILDAVKKC